MKNRTAIITGAAQGIGCAIAARLVQENCFAVIVDTNAEKGKQFAGKLGAGSAEFFRCDVSDEEEVAAFFETFKKKFKELDILVNNAGILMDSMIHKMPFADFKKVIDVNLQGTWLMCREAAKIMRDQKKGRIVNISSRAWLGNPGQSNYSASKAAVIGLTRVLALELGRYNVLVNAVAPGLIETPLTASLPPEVLEKLKKAQPTGKAGSPEDVANAVAFLADERTQFITGQTLYVDGGKSIGSNF